MNEYTFEVVAAVTVAAESEEQARERLHLATIHQDTDVDYNGISVYLPSYEVPGATCVGHLTFEED